MNYLQLRNPPKQFVKLCKQTFKKYKGTDWKIEMNKYHFSSDIEYDDLIKFQNIIPEKIHTVSINLITKAIKSRGTHIDRKRKAALQFPIVCDPNVHQVYVLQDEKNLNKLTPTNTGGFRKQNKPHVDWANQKYPDMPMFHEYDEQYFEVHNVEKYIPYITDTSLPHGGLHYEGVEPQSINERWFISISLPDRINVYDRKKVFAQWL